MNDQMAMVFICAIIVLILINRYFSSNDYTTEIPLSPGTYRVGEDLSPGKGDLVAVSGGGEFCIKERGNKDWNNAHKLNSSGSPQPSRYRNLTLNKYDILEINGNVTMYLTPPAPISDIREEKLSVGIYRFGVDVPPAKYNLKVTSGDGQITFFEPQKKEFSIYQDMAADAPNKASTYDNLLCEKGSVLWIEGNLELELTKSKKQHGLLHRLENENP